MCADNETALPLGAPPTLQSFDMVWGGISCFVPVGQRGRAAWRYAQESIAILHGLPCHVSLDPQANLNTTCAAIDSGLLNLSYVFDRCIGRSWNELGALGVAQDVDRADFPDENAMRAPLAYHILLTTANPAPVALLERVALCHGWDACDVPVCDAAATGAHPAIKIGVDGAVSVAVNEACILDDQLHAVERLLDDGLVHVDTPLGLCVEALLYSYLFQHNQEYFGGRLDRVFSLDNGRCAELLVAAAERAFPGGNYGRNEWARMYADPIAREAQSFIRFRSGKTSD
jgi:hypothetical protein